MITITITNTLASKVGSGGSAPPAPVAPMNIVAPAITGTPTVGQTLSCTTGTWTGTAPISYGYQWKRNGSNIGSATNSTYLLVVGDDGTNITCEVTGTNIVGSSSAISNTVAINAIAPVNTVAPVISGNSVIGSTLTTTNGTWTGTAPITYTYQWLNEGADIVGATNSTYVSTVADIGFKITCKVTGTNAGGSSYGTSNFIIGTYKPVNTVLPVISGSNVVGQVLTTTNGTWTAYPTPTYTYQWKRNGSNIASATSSTYTLVQADATFPVTCVVTATNSEGNTSATSNSLTILDANAAAFLTAAAITDTTIVNATNQLVVSLKGYSIYTKLYALHLYVGGTATTHKWNVINPLDTNAAYRIVWSGGVTHDANGVTGNGTNGYGETYVQPSTNLIQNNTHIAFYNRTNLQNANAPMGIIDGTLNATLRVITRNTSNQSSYSVNDNTSSVVTSVTDSRGFYIASRTASNSRKLYKNGTAIQTATTASVARSTATIPVLGQKGATNTMGAYLAVNFALSSTGEGLNDTEAANYYTAVQAFQTALSRQV